MPNSVSARKRVRQNAARRSVNRWRTRRVKEQVKTFLSAVQARDVATAESEFRKTVALLDRVADSKSIHKNAAARTKSRLSRRLKAIKQGAGA